MKLMVVAVTAAVHSWALVKHNRKIVTVIFSLLSIYIYMYVYIHAVILELTFAGIDALKPPVISVSIIAGTSTILIPSTTRSTATGSA